MVDDESMLLRVIIITTIALLVGCASVPPDLACRAGIKRLVKAANDREIYSAAERADFEAIVRTAEKLEDTQSFEMCERLVRQERPREIDYQCVVNFRPVLCTVRDSLRIPNG